MDVLYIDVTSGGLLLQLLLGGVGGVAAVFKIVFSRSRGGSEGADDAASLEADTSASNERASDAA